MSHSHQLSLSRTLTDDGYYVKLFMTFRYFVNLLSPNELSAAFIIINNSLKTKYIKANTPEQKRILEDFDLSDICYDNSSQSNKELIKAVFESLQNCLGLILLKGMQYLEASMALDARGLRFKKFSNNIKVQTPQVTLATEVVNHKVIVPSSPAAANQHKLSQLSLFDKFIIQFDLAISLASSLNLDELQNCFDSINKLIVKTITPLNLIAEELRIYNFVNSKLIVFDQTIQNKSELLTRFFNTIHNIPLLFLHKIKQHFELVIYFEKSHLRKSKIYPRANIHLKQASPEMGDEDFVSDKSITENLPSTHASPYISQSLFAPLPLPELNLNNQTEHERVQALLLDIFKF